MKIVVNGNGLNPDSPVAMPSLGRKFRCDHHWTRVDEIEFRCKKCGEETNGDDEEGLTG